MSIQEPEATQQTWQRESCLHDVVKLSIVFALTPMQGAHLEQVSGTLQRVVGIF